jgi:hypothetical protein
VLLTDWSDCFVFEIRQLRHSGAFRDISDRLFQRRFQMARVLSHNRQALERGKHAFQVEFVSLGVCLSRVGWDFGL